MKILIIGAKGMLGQELVKVFSDQTVASWDRQEGDITNQELIQVKIRALEPDLLINAAAYNEVDRAEQEPELARLINGQAVGYLAAAAAELDIPMVHYSTDYVFAGDRAEGYREDDQPAPDSAYAQSKHLGEIELLKHTPKSLKV